MRLVSATAAGAALVFLSALSHAQGNFRVEIDGAPAGSASAFWTGELMFDTLSRRQEDPDGRSIWWKVMVPGLPWYPATMQIDWGLPDPMFGWLQESIQGLATRKGVRVYENKKDSDIISRQTDLFDVVTDFVSFPGGNKEPRKPGAPAEPNLIGMGLRARGIITKKPGGSTPPANGRTWNPANFEFRITDSTSDPVDIQAKKWIPIVVRPGLEIIGSTEQAVAVDDIVIVVPGTAYRFFDTWFQETLAVAPILDPADDGSKVKRMGEVVYILDDGSRVVLRLEGMGIRTIQASGTDFIVRVYVDRVRLMNKQ